jgi:hypothetical protein
VPVICDSRRIQRPVPASFYGSEIFKLREKIFLTNQPELPLIASQIEMIRARIQNKMHKRMCE